MTGTHVLPCHVAVVLHYESASPQRWLRKFCDHARFLRHARDAGGHAPPKADRAASDGAGDGMATVMDRGIDDEIGDAMGDRMDAIERGIVDNHRRARTEENELVLAARAAAEATPTTEREALFHKESTAAAHRLLAAQESDEAGAVEAARADAIALWERYKRQPPNLPSLGGAERWRILPELGITLLQPFCTATEMLVEHEHACLEAALAII